MDKISIEQMQDISLTTWRCAFNGSEPICYKSIEQFSEKFSQFGFNKNRILPCYGMAETTLLVSGKPGSKEPVFTSVNKHKLAMGIFKNSLNGTTLVSSGVLSKGMSVEIVNPDLLQKCEKGHIGEILISGPNVCQGYWNAKEINDKIFNISINKTQKAYFRSGDLGYLQDDQLYIVGRLKDLIIVNGRNIYPQDIERIVENDNQFIQKRTSAAFAIEKDGREHLILVCEVARTHRKDNLQPAFDQIRKVIAQHFEISPYEIVFIAPAQSLHTTSGKIERQKTKQLYLEDVLVVVARNKFEAWGDNKRKEISIQGPSANELIQMSQPELTKMLCQLIKENVAALCPKNTTYLIDDETNIMDLGFNSMTLSELKLNLDQTLLESGLKIPIDYFFKFQSIQALGTELSHYVLTHFDEFIHFSPAFHDAKSTSLSYSQMFFWGDPEISGQKKIAARALLHGPLDIKRLEYAINQLLKRQQIFWYNFSLKEPIQTYGESHYVDLPILYTDESGTPFNEELAKKFFRKKLLEQFDWKSPPFFKAYLISLENNKYDFSFFIPHIVADGSCVEIILNELTHYYRSDVDLPSLPAHYIDHCFWEKEIFTVKEKEKSQFWCNYIGRQGITKLPKEWIDSEENINSGNMHHFIIPEALNKEFIALCATLNCTAEYGYLSLIRFLLYLLFAQKNIFIAYLRHGRYDKRLTSVIGCYVTPDCYKLQMNDKTSFAESVDNLLKNSAYLSSYQMCRTFDKTYPLMQQLFKYKKLSSIFATIVTPFVRPQFTKHGFPKEFGNAYANIFCNEIIDSLSAAITNKLSSLISQKHYETVSNRCVPIVNILPSFYLQKPYNFGEIEIINHSYIEAMNIKSKYDLYFYLGRDQNLDLLLSIIGPLKFSRQQQMAETLIKLMEIILLNPGINAAAARNKLPIKIAK